MPPEVAGGTGPNQGRPLAAMRAFHAPNLVILTRSAEPPLPQLRKSDGTEEARDAGTSAGLESDSPGNKRELRGMSRASARNLSKALSMLDWAKNGPCIHVSVTYGKSIYPKTKEDLTSEKSAIVRDLGRFGLTGIWRLEYQSRESQAERVARLARGERRKRGQGGALKVPHWHFLLWIGDLDFPLLCQKLEAWWHRFSGNSSPYSINITSGDQARGVWYLGMHAQKREQSPGFAVGRWWGYVDRERFLGAADLHCHGQIDERTRVWWARLYRRQTGGRTRNTAGLSWFLPRLYQTRVSEWILERIEWERITRHDGYRPF